MTLLKSIVFGAALSLASGALAQTVYTDRAAFLAAISNPATTTFNTITGDISVGGGETVEGYTFTGQTQVDSLIDAPVFEYNPVNGVDGTTYFSLGGLGNGSVFTVGLGGNFTAFGFDTHNYDATNERSEIFIGGLSLGLTPQLRGQTGFLGFVSSGSSFSSVSIVGRGSDVFNGFDNFTVGAAAAVPEAGSWVLLIAGFGLVGAAMRRRAHATA